jgi:CheY-like chemotaxis protein
VSASPVHRGDAFLEVSVQDTGIGLKAEDLGRIFRGFVQVDASDARQYGGAGIGLALVRTLVEQHGGRIWAESEGLGRGARFVFRLPLLEPPRQKRVLVVEDEGPVLETLAAGLEEAGFRVDRAPSGGQALAALRENPPDCLILDIGLPDMDGWEVLRRVRGDERTRALPILVLTGLGDVHAWQAHAFGANEFLAKPVSLSVLSGTVRSLLGWPAASPAAVQEPPAGPPGDHADQANP